MFKKNSVKTAAFQCFVLLLSAFFIVSCSSDPIHDSVDVSDSLSLDSSAQLIPQEKVFGYIKDSVEVVHDTIHKNEFLADILLKYHINYQQIAELERKSKPIFDVRYFRVNKPYEVIYELGDTLHTAKSFIYHPNKIEYIKYDFGDSIDISTGAYLVDTVERVLSGVIQSSMYEAIDSAGGSMELAWMLSDVYAWQINFFGLQKMDSFRVLYTELEVGGEVVGLDKILAAEFTHAGHSYDAYWYENPQDSIADYYNSEGESMRKSFLKAPLKYKRISSGFSYRRYHPVFHYYRPHLGVDYAAPLGTPVVALGDGKVIMASKGYNRGGGNMIKIEHNGTYTTGYLHLSRFAKGMHVGKYVKQGEVIAYVGSTGASTGPHLDFRVWKDGKNINPLTMNPPAAKALTDEQKSDFEKIRVLLEKRLYPKD